MNIASTQQAVWRQAGFSRSLTVQSDFVPPKRRKQPERYAKWRLNWLENNIKIRLKT
jgi:hypothetical protein